MTWLLYEKRGYEDCFNCTDGVGLDAADPLIAQSAKSRPVHQPRTGHCAGPFLFGPDT